MYFYQVPIKTFKYKLRLTKNQRQTFQQWLGGCRFLYNCALEHRIAVYQATGTGTTYENQAGELPAIKKMEGLKWLGQIPSQTLQATLERLHQAYKNFFNGAGFPKWARKYHYNSITVKSVKIDTHNRLKLPKIGSVKYYASRRIEGKLKRAVITRHGHSWYISVVCEVAPPEFCPATENQRVGLDWGTTHFYTLSTGHHERNLRLSQKYGSHLRVLQRSLARKKPGSHNWKNVKRQLKRLHAKIARIRKDWHHRQSTELVRKYEMIFVEDLRVKNLTKSSKGTIEEPGKMVRQKSGLNRSILETSPGHFFQLLAYKCDWYQRGFAKVPAQNTSRECSACGHISKENRKTQDTFACEQCGHRENADVNAAKNIRSRGNAALAANVGRLARA